MELMTELYNQLIGDSKLLWSDENITNNETSVAGDDSWKEEFKPILNGLLMLILIVVMLAMGCEITWRGLWGHIKRPVALTIGLMSQFAITPLVAYGILLASNVTGIRAAGVLIIACCPGGVLSNTFTYFFEGDLALSVTMTTASTIMAMLMMPANLWLYGRSFESSNFTIPYKDMALSLIGITSPVLVGMILKWKFPKVAEWVAKLGSYLGIIIMFICIGIEVALFSNILYDVPLKLYLIVLFLPVVGLTLGYGLAFILKQNVGVCKTVSIECGVQNVPVALTIIAMSFPLTIQDDIILLPWIYGFAMVTGCSSICLLYHFLKWWKQRRAKSESRAKEEPNGDILPSEVEDLLQQQNGGKVEFLSMQEKPRLLENKNTINITPESV